MLETNELTRKLRTLLHPRAALIAYAREDNSHYVYDNSYFIEVRDIDESGIMGEGRPVTAEFMNELVRGYSERHSATPYGRIPSKTCCGATRVREARNTSGTTLPGNV